MIKWEKVRKKPIVVEAFQLTEEFHQTRKVEDGVIVATLVNDMTIVNLMPNRFIVETLEGDMEAKVGDYIIKGVNGEIYPCKKEIFEKTYDVLDGGNN